MNKINKILKFWKRKKKKLSKINYRCNCNKFNQNYNLNNNNNSNYILIIIQPIINLKIYSILFKIDKIIIYFKISLLILIKIKII